MPETTLNKALRTFEIAEANLAKAERLLEAITERIPQGVVFGGDAEYDSNCHHFQAIVAALPKIKGWKPDIRLMDLDEIAQSRFDAMEIGEIESTIAIERNIEEPARELLQYRLRFDQMRRELVRDALRELIASVDKCLAELLPPEAQEGDADPEADPDGFDQLKSYVTQITTLMGSSMAKPPRWSDLSRHLNFGMGQDLRDIVRMDWPAVKAGLEKSMYGENEPTPVDVDDLDVLVSAKPRGPVATKLKWVSLGEEDFERLIFALVAEAPGYENAAWLTKTQAADRGRDLSAERILVDSLGGTTRQRVIFQCKHWLTKSVGMVEFATLREQMRSWEPPRVDVHVIATSGRFSSDAVSAIERHNQSDSALRIEMWPESHLERLLAARPVLIAEFGLR